MKPKCTMLLSKWYGQQAYLLHDAIMTEAEGRINFSVCSRGSGDISIYFYPPESDDLEVKEDKKDKIKKLKKIKIKDKDDEDVEVDIEWAEDVEEE